MMIAMTTFLNYVIHVFNSKLLFHELGKMQNNCLCSTITKTFKMTPFDKTAAKF